MNRAAVAGPTAQRVRDVARSLGLAYLLSLPLQSLPLPALGGQVLMLPDLLLAATWLVAAAAFVLGRGRGLRRVAAPLVAGVVLLAALALSAVHAGRPASSYLKLVAFASMVLAPALLLYLFDERTQVLRALKAFAAGCGLAVAVGFVGLLLFYLDRQMAEAHLMCGYGALHRSASYPRLCAPFRNFNMFASYLVATTPLAMAFVARRTGRWAALALAVAASVVALFTLSAGIGAFALVLAFAVAPLLGSGVTGRGLRVTAWVGAALVELLFVLASLGTFVASGAGTFSIGARDYLWWDGSRPSILAAGVRTWLAHPLLGLGYGSSVARVTDPRSYVPADQIDTGRYPPFADMEAHNLLLSVGGQAGLLGFLAFVAALLVLVAPGVRARLSEEDGRLRAAVLASVVGVVVVHGVFIAVEEARHFWPLLAMASLVAKLGVEPESARVDDGGAA